MQPSVPPNHWVQRTDLELEDALRAACAASHADGRPVLLEFSASWCIDCRTLASLETDPVLSAELARWHRVRADVGRFDRHEPFRTAFGVGSIAHWVAFGPADCATPPPDWPRRQQGVLEPATGQSGPRTAADVVAWLEAARRTP